MRNDQVEKDLQAKGKQESSYEGAQDTGDKAVRQQGTEVQRRDGQPQNEEQNEEE